MAAARRGDRRAAAGGRRDRPRQDPHGRARPRRAHAGRERPARRGPQPRRLERRLGDRGRHRRRPARARHRHRGQRADPRRGVRREPASAPPPTGCPPRGLDPRAQLRPARPHRRDARRPRRRLDRTRRRHRQAAGAGRDARRRPLGRVEPERLKAAREAALPPLARPLELASPSLPPFGAPRAMLDHRRGRRAPPPARCESAAAHAQLAAGARTRGPTSAPPAPASTTSARPCASRGRRRRARLPTLPSAPPRWDELEDTDAQLRATGRLTRLCGPVNSSGLVAVSTPQRRPARRPRHRDRARRRAPPPIDAAFRTIVTKSFLAPAFRET